MWIIPALQYYYNSDDNDNYNNNNNYYYYYYYTQSIRGSFGVDALYTVHIDVLVTYY